MTRRKGVAPKKNGRPTKMTPELQDAIVTAIRAGNYVEVAAAHVGISRECLYNWMREGARHPEGPLGSFSDAVKKAMASSEVRDVALVGQAAATQWQAAAWRLERKHPERWGRKERIELSGDAKAPIALARADLEQLTRAQLDALESAAQATLPAGTAGKGEGDEGEEVP